MRRLLPIVLLLVLAPPASAQELVKRDRRGDAAAPLDITRLTMSSDGDGLVIVDVGFAGNLEARIGRGSLRRALVGIVVRPAGGKPTIVATTGASKRPEAGKRGPGRVVVVNRDGRRLRFVLEGVEAPRSVYAATVARPTRKGLAAFDPFGLTILEILSEAEDRKIKQRNDQLLMAGITPREPTCPELRRMRSKLREERAELVVRRAHADGSAQRERIQEAINTVDAQLRHVEHDIQIVCGTATPPVTDPGAPPEAFATSWAHGTGRSRICVYVSGAPGAEGDVTVDGTNSPRVQAFTLDGSGHATVIYEISSYGTYPVGVRWGQRDGTSTTKNGSVTVDQNPGPAPPSGFSSCPPPS